MALSESWAGQRTPFGLVQLACCSTHSPKEDDSNQVFLTADNLVEENTPYTLNMGRETEGERTLKVRQWIECCKQERENEWYKRSMRSTCIPQAL